MIFNITIMKLIMIMPIKKKNNSNNQEDNLDETMIKITNLLIN